MQSPVYKTIEKELGVRFKRRSLLKRALTHSSYIQDQPTSGLSSNEVLEFLGDAVLELITREYLYKKFPDATEGKLSKMKRNYTSTDALYRFGMSLNIGRFLLMDKGEEQTGGRKRVSNIAGAMEAIIGALYLDQGLSAVKKFLDRTLFRKIIAEQKDYKSYLNEWIMKKQYTLSYKVIKETGPQHDKKFHVALYVNNKKVATGCGETKKRAEQKAAEKFLNKLSVTPDEH
ncbi:MAG TPA: ribonuclease III [candidate division WOR-3 bacterium]|uniref:Ribonuclease 3 n=1 Tax=candidate division WOR-3 bacterium TaxID=2052148 RepID=A0A9C9K0W0_UNCW3|nr:ribonuclease III [candidate division WOR-3 bacterium]